MSEVPVFMRGDNLPHTRPISTHSQNSSSKCRHLHHSRGKSTLSMHRARKKPKHGFRATQQPGIRNCFFVNSDTSPRAVSGIAIIRELVISLSMSVTSGPGG